MFLPTTASELKKLKWDRLDIILVTGDAYIDSPYIGVAVIGRVSIFAVWESRHYSGESPAAVWIPWSPTTQRQRKKDLPMI
ncbi:MAG: hypothetical protein ABSC54_09205 [Smithellaceae bacterium]